MSSTPVIEPFFLQSSDRRLFALRIRPPAGSKAAILYAPPFAEEMHRFRALAAEQARALAERGFDCLLVDPSGTGDSSGDFRDATWEHWQADLAEAAAWLERESGHPLVLWGARLGALQAATLAAASPGRFSRMLFWQPVADGKAFVTQFLRLRAASMAMRETERETGEQVRQRLAAGETIEVAGYELSGALASGIERQRMDRLEGLAGSQIVWVEMVSAGGEVSLASQRTVDKLGAIGARVAATAVEAPPMWQIHEPESAPNLVARTVEILAGEAP